jgi:hypothetical protein
VPKEQNWRQKKPIHHRKKKTAKTKGIQNISQTSGGKSSQIDRSNFHIEHEEENEENDEEDEEDEEEDESQNYYQENFLRMENIDEESLAAYLSTRELNENDYELLLRLDENLTKKTLEEEKISKITIIQKETSNTTCVDCTVCLENIKKDQIISILPCKHEFHQLCIETWLKEYSKMCPLCKNEM